MKYFIYHPKPGKDRTPAEVECTSLIEAETEYKRLQELYPSREMSLIVVNDWGERIHLHEGRWE